MIGFLQIPIKIFAEENSIRVGHIAQYLNYVALRSGAIDARNASVIHWINGHSAVSIEDIVSKFLAAEEGSGFRIFSKNMDPITAGHLPVESTSVAVDSSISLVYDNPFLFVNVTQSNNSRYTCINVLSTLDQEERIGVICKHFLKDLQTEEVKPANTLYSMAASRDGITFVPVGEVGNELTRDNYAEDVLVAYDRIVLELTAKHPRGRLTILDGPPGTGKTHMLRGLIHSAHSSQFVVVPSHSVQSLGDPQMITALMNFRNRHQRPLVFVIEDADECLWARDGGNNSSVSALLNFGDGLLGAGLDVRVVATTNALREELDPALMRPGRLSTMVKVGPLEIGHAFRVYIRIKGGFDKVSPAFQFEDFNQLAQLRFNTNALTIAMVYQLALDDSWKSGTKEHPKLGF